MKNKENNKLFKIKMVNKDNLNHRGNINSGHYRKTFCFLHHKNFYDFFDENPFLIRIQQYYIPLVNLAYL